MSCAYSCTYTCCGLYSRCGQSDPPPASLPSSSEDGGTAEGEEDQLRLTSEEAKALVSTDSLVRCLEVAVNHWDTLSQIPMQVRGVAFGLHRARVMILVCVVCVCVLCVHVWVCVCVCICVCICMYTCVYVCVSISEP